VGGAGGRRSFVLKVSWRHSEGEQEADALRFWDGDGAVRCFAARSVDSQTSAPLLELARRPAP
jgi:streptomycin 6-kinase